MSEEVYRSTIAQGLFYVDGKPLSLEDYPMFEAVYDGNYPRMLLKTGRQITKSTTLAAFMIAEGIATASFKSFYVSPSQEQTRKFSHTRVAKILAYSPDLRRGFVGPESIDNVLLRMLTNGSEMAFTYALDDPDRARGYSADRCLFDEVQDILYESVIPVIEECFDARCEALTRRGWVPVPQLTMQDELADVDPAGRIEWHRPTQLIQKTHTGDMVTFTHDFMSLRVTDTHQMWVHSHGETRAMSRGAWSFTPAREVVNGRGEAYRFTGPAGLRTSVTPARRAFPGLAGAHGVNARGLDLPYDGLARLVGWYLAEGSIKWAKRKGVNTCPRPVITQSEGRYLQDILDTLKYCGLTYSVASNSKKPYIKHVTVNSRILGEYLLPLGGSCTKYIPEEFFASEVLLQQVLEALYLGDASARKDMSWDRWTYFTVSERLADDVHRAWTLCGRSPTKRLKQYAPDKIAYEVCSYVDNFFIFYRRKNQAVVEAVVDEPVYCFTLPNHRPVMRGGPGLRPVVTGQCMANSNYQYSAYAGTPKTMENTIEFLWSQSSQTEWCIPCDGCRKWTFVVSTKAIGKQGPICLSCGKNLNPRKGQWIDMATDQGIKGFHISQPVMPVNVPAAWQPGSVGHAQAVERWQKLLYKMETPLYGESRFLNECIGVSTSTGVRLLTKEALEKLCDERLEVTRLPDPRAKDGIVRVTAGVDWSGGGAEVKGSEGSMYKSRTVLHIWGQQADGRLRTLTYKVFPNGHPTGWIDEIVEMCNAWGVNMLVGDAGEGALANAYLRQRMGDHRVIAIRYMNLSKPVSWNPDSNAYHVDRTTVIDNYARFILHGQVVYPKLTHAQTAINDILNVYEEVTLQGKKTWRHSPTMPDDCLHAQIFGWFAWMLLTSNLNLQ